MVARMDIYQVIESDHELARALVNRIAGARNPEWRYQLCRELAQVIHVHAKATQIAFYDLLSDYVGIRYQLAHAQEEQDIAETFLKEALSYDPEDLHFMSLFCEARAELEQHMQRETGEIFDFARTVFDAAQAEAIGHRMRALKDDFIEANYMNSPSLRADAGYYS